MRLVLFSFASVVILSSCVFSPPHINFAVSGESHAPFSGMQGSLVTINGLRVDKNGSDIPHTDQRLYTIIFLTPGMTGNSSEGTSTASTPRLHNMTLAQGVGSVKVEAKIEWDKGLDVVRIDNQDFKRGDGTVFVVEKVKERSAQVWQLNPSQNLKDAKAILNYAKSEMPELESLRLATFDAQEYLRMKKEFKTED